MKRFIYCEKIIEWYKASEDSQSIPLYCKNEATKIVSYQDLTFKMCNDHAESIKKEIPLLEVTERKGVTKHAVS